MLMERELDVQKVVDVATRSRGAVVGSESSVIVLQKPEQPIQVPPING
jgi:hypothetical protein